MFIKLYLNQQTSGTRDSGLMRPNTRTMFGWDQQKRLRPRVKHGGGGFMVWSCVSAAEGDLGAAEPWRYSGWPQLILSFILVKNSDMIWDIWSTWIQMNYGQHFYWMNKRKHHVHSLQHQQLLQMLEWGRRISGNKKQKVLEEADSETSVWNILEEEGEMLRDRHGDLLDAASFNVVTHSSSSVLKWILFLQQLLIEGAELMLLLPL